MGWQRSGRLFNPQLLLYRTANSDWKVTHDKSPERQGRIFHGGKTAGVKRRKTPGWNQDVTLGACEVDEKLQGKLLSPNYMAFLPLFWEQDVILWPQPSLILRCFSLLHERSTGVYRYVHHAKLQVLLEFLFISIVVYSFKMSSMYTMCLDQLYPSLPCPSRPRAPVAFPSQLHILLILTDYYF